MFYRGQDSPQRILWGEWAVAGQRNENSNFPSETNGESSPATCILKAHTHQRTRSAPLQLEEYALNTQF